MFTNLRIGRRLQLAFGFIVLLMVVATTFAVLGIRSLAGAMELVHDRTAKIQVGNELEISQYSRGLLTAGIPMMEARSDIEARMAAVKAKRVEADALLARLKEMAVKPELKQMTQEVENAIQATKANNNKVTELALAGKAGEARRLYLEKTGAALEAQRRSFATLAAFPDRVARRRQGAELQLAAGGPAQLAPSSTVTADEFLVAVEAEDRPLHIIPLQAVHPVAVGVGMINQVVESAHTHRQPAPALQRLDYQLGFRIVPRRQARLQMLRQLLAIGQRRKRRHELA